jgi:hypothetical protein
MSTTDVEATRSPRRRWADTSLAAGLIVAAVLLLRWLFAAPSPTVGPLWAVDDWGPRSTRAGQAFGLQPNGDSAIWVAGRGERKVRIVLADRVLRTVVSPGVATASVSPALLATLAGRPGKLTVALIDPQRGTRQEIGTLVVTE